MLNQFNKDALTEAVDLYWDKGWPLPKIQARLYKERGLAPEGIQVVLNEMGKAILRFDSDASSDDVKSALLLS